MKTRPIRATLLLAAVLLSACNTRALLACPGRPAPALNVTVVEAGTGRYLAAGATVVAVDGSFRETLGPGDYAPGGELASRAGAVGRPGRYEVLVTHEGHADFSTTVRAASDACGVVTAAVRAVLEQR